MHYTAVAWNYTVQSTSSKSLTSRLDGRRVSSLTWPEYEANVAKSDGVYMIN